jgi:DNA-directed RNA polymerase specialized sigma24 family protein
MSALEVDDPVHDIFIKVQRVATQYRPHRRARTLSWIFKVAERLILDRVRQQKSRESRESRYGNEKPPQGGEVELPKQLIWEYGDPSN